jgi:hypothetical protein
LLLDRLGIVRLAKIAAAKSLSFALFLPAASIISFGRERLNRRCKFEKAESILAGNIQSENSIVRNGFDGDRFNKR